MFCYCRVESGLINTHVHTSQQLARGIADDVDLLTWLHGRIWPYESNMTDEDSYLSTLLCGIELIHSGVRDSQCEPYLGIHQRHFVPITCMSLLIYKNWLHNFHLIQSEQSDTDSSA